MLNSDFCYSPLGVNGGCTGKARKANGSCTGKARRLDRSTAKTGQGSMGGVTRPLASHPRSHHERAPYFRFWPTSSHHPALSDRYISGIMFGCIPILLNIPLQYCLPISPCSCLSSHHFEHRCCHCLWCRPARSVQQSLRVENCIFLLWRVCRDGNILSFNQYQLDHALCARQWCCAWSILIVSTIFQHIGVRGLLPTHYPRSVYFH